MTLRVRVEDLLTIPILFVHTLPLGLQSFKPVDGDSLHSSISKFLNPFLAKDTLATADSVSKSLG
jgi:hypothetical protein